MNPLIYIKNKGIKRAFQVIYKYKIDVVERRILSIIFKKKKLLNVIIIESHNDFDCNGGAFYDYLLSNNKNNNYKIVWLLKNKLPDNLPYNVKAFGLYRPSIQKNYYITRAKFLFADEHITSKNRTDQVSLYLTHGGITFKNVKGRVVVPEAVDYILSPSANYDPLMCENYSIPFPNNKMLHFGMPKNDCIFDTCDVSELEKLKRKKYSRNIIWLPTFRKVANSERNDSKREYPLGLPLFNTLGELQSVDILLGELDVQLIIKLHPSQDMTNIRKIPKMNNIVVLDDLEAKSKGINIYKMMQFVDALISDYSSVAYSFLLLDKPIGFILNDLNDYNRGFIVDDKDFILPGSIINCVDDFIGFIQDVLRNDDNFHKKRLALRNWLYEHYDGDSCKRLMNFLKI